MNYRILSAFQFIKSACLLYKKEKAIARLITMAHSNNHQRITLGFVADTNGPLTIK